MRQRRPTMVQQGEIFRLLQEHIEPMGQAGALQLGQAGFCKYKPGWNDIAVAKAVGCSVESVRQRRRELYGNVKTWERAQPVDDGVTLAAILDAINQLTMRIDALSADLRADGRLNSKPPAELTGAKLPIAKRDDDQLPIWAR